MAPELADHFEKTADWPRAIKYLRLAADRAVGRYAHREATVLLRQALELARQLPHAARMLTETEVLEKLATVSVAPFDIRAIETHEAPRVRAVHPQLQPSALTQPPPSSSNARETMGRRSAGAS